MTTSLLISTCRQANSLAKVLASLEGEAPLLKEIVISEDGCDPATAAVIDRLASCLATTVLHVSAPWDGFRLAEVRNRGLQLITADYVIQTDGDCVAHPRFIADHIQFARRGRYLQGQRACIEESAVGAFEPNFITRWKYLLTGRMVGRKYGLRWAPQLDFDSSYTTAVGCNMSFFMDDLRQINGYDLTMIGWGAEDYDIASRLGLINVTPLSVHRACILYHLNHPQLAPVAYTKKIELVDAQRARGLYRCDRGLLETAPAHVRRVRPAITHPNEANVALLEMAGDTSR